MNPLAVFIEQYANHHGVPSIENTSNTNQLQKFIQLLEHSQTDHGWVTRTLSELLSIPWLDLDYFEPTKFSLHAISENLLRQHAVFPLFQRNETLYIGIANPFQLSVLEAIRFYIETNVSPILVELPKLETLRKTLLSNPALPLQALPPPTSENASQITTSNTMDDPPLIRYVNQLLQHAIEQHASDIHFEPQTNNLSIRFRIDGVLHPQPSPPAALADRIFSRIKIMAQLDIAEKRLPQNGRFNFTVSDSTKRIDCRVSTCPTLLGEKIAIRLLDSEKSNLDITKLGLTLQQQELFIAGLSKSQGMILVTGPTGSGKTLTLYSALHHLNQPSVNISSVEDPVEIRLPGINQVHIRPSIGLDFAESLKAFLRQDPDIIMVGEMRDPITAQIGIQAAHTGHLVLSTLHTNSATETLTRLLNMGIPAYNVSSSVSLIIAQRLARKLCLHCRQPTTLSATSFPLTEVKLMTELSVFKAVGCKHCIQGYQGRIGIFELLPITPMLAESILENYSTITLEKQGQAEGMLTLKEAAFEKVKEGIIDITEMQRIIS